MGELPEIEVARRDLEREVAGRKINSVTIGARQVVRDTTRADFTRRVEGRKIRSVDRRGVAILLNLDSDDTILLHLGSEGRLVRQKAAKAPSRAENAELSIEFTQGGALHVAGSAGDVSVRLVPRGSASQDPELDVVFDPVDRPVPWQQLGAALVGRSRQGRTKLKAVLQAPGVVAGIGNVYGDEILFAAALRHDRAPESLSSQEIRRLYRSVLQVVGAAVKARGVSLGDDDVDMFGEPGKYNAELQVYGRHGQLCHRCRGTVERVRWQRKYAYFCPGCQS